MSGTFATPSRKVIHARQFRVTQGSTPIRISTTDGIGPDAYDQIERYWKPLLNHAATADAHWDWRAWTSNLGSGNTSFSISVNGEYQAFIVVKHLETMRCLRDGGLPCCYIEYLAVAPWNRKDVASTIMMSRERISPLGGCLVLRAIELSEALGYAGRVGWHALPTSENNYRTMFGNLPSAGMDVRKGMNWFEIGRPEAGRFKDWMEKSVLDIV